MATETFPLIPKCSISLGLMARLPEEFRARTPAFRAITMGLTGNMPDPDDDVLHAGVLVETQDASLVAEHVKDGTCTQLSEHFLSFEGRVPDIVELTGLEEVRRIETKNIAQLHLDAALPDIGLVAPKAGARPVEEDGTGVLIGIIDTGFDLAHPMFRDDGGKLRVDALLDQTAPGKPEFTTEQLEARWRGGRGPGADDNGHGTHVAAIAAGSQFRAVQGVAPGARFLLVKTDRRDWASAITWVFEKAGSQPCVVNLSMGHHNGAHDGTGVEERLIVDVSGPGKIVVVSAGNERQDGIHVGGDFNTGQSEQVFFDLIPGPTGEATVILNFFHDPMDQFAVTLVTPTGHSIPAPPPGAGATTKLLAPFAMKLGRKVDPDSGTMQIAMIVDVVIATTSELLDWRVQLTCLDAKTGRIDGWFTDNGLATFQPHLMLDNASTIALPGTGPGCLTVASHVTKNAWDSDSGVSRNEHVLGCSSPFSSLGPTRIGAPKPDISAPGQMITAALADRSAQAAAERFAKTSDRLLTLDGTSMAAPVVAGAVALLLQQKPSRTTTEVRDILARTATRDTHTGLAPWDPTYGFGKLNIAAALR